MVADLCQQVGYVGGHLVRVVGPDSGQYPAGQRSWHIRDKTLDGQHTAATQGRHGGRPKVVDDMLLFARALRDQGVTMPEIAKKLTIKTGKNKDRHPSVASRYRALADDSEDHDVTVGASA